MYHYSASPIKDANKLTANTANQFLAISGGFKHISVFNEGNTELRISIDNDSTSGIKIIFISAGQPFEGDIIGKELNFSVASGNTIFKYVIR